MDLWNPYAFIIIQVDFENIAKFKYGEGMTLVDFGKSFKNQNCSRRSPRRRGRRRERTYLREFSTTTLRILTVRKFLNR